MSHLSIILLSPVNKSSCLNQERNMHISSTFYQWKQSKNSSKQICSGFWCETTTGEGFFHWRKHYYGFVFGQKWWFYVKMSYWLICFLQTRSFSFHKTLIDGLERCGLLVDYCDVFISCLDSHSDGTHSLQRIHWWTSDTKFLQICSDEETNPTIAWMAWGWVFFGWTIPLKWEHMAYISGIWSSLTLKAVHSNTDPGSDSICQSFEFTASVCTQRLMEEQCVFSTVVLERINVSCSSRLRVRGTE